MRSAKSLTTLTLIFLLYSACSVLPSVQEPLPAATPTVQPTVFQFPTLTPAPTPIPTTATSIPVPAWVMDFSDPILKAVEDQRPDIEDDFAPYNQGWFIDNPANTRRPYFAHVQDGALFLELPEATGKKDLTVYNHRWTREDFVLSFDFKFGKTEPDDILRFQYGQNVNQSMAVDLSKNESWTFFWSLHNSLRSTHGTYDYFAPEYLNAVIIMRGSECALYLNRDPVDYLSDCRSQPVGKPSRLTMTFQLLGTGRPALVVIDHVKLWDLDKIQGLP